MAGMQIAVETVDRLCGEILNALKETGEYEETFILFTTDHGLPFPMMKCNLYDDGIGVAFLLRYPGMPEKHCVKDTLLSQVDVFPTLCDILKLEKPVWLQGESFYPVIKGEQDEVREAVFAEINYHVAYEPVRCVRTKKYKYIVRWDNGYDKTPPTHMDDSLSKEVFHENGYFEKKLAKEELYDLMLDPQERENLAEEMEHPAVKEEMEKILTDWQKKTKDPLLTEQKIELPEGAICCTVDSYSTKTQVILPECRKYLADLRGVLQNTIK